MSLREYSFPVVFYVVKAEPKFDCRLCLKETPNKWWAVGRRSRNDRESCFWQIYMLSPADLHHEPTLCWSTAFSWIRDSIYRPFHFSTPTKAATVDSPVPCAIARALCSFVAVTAVFRLGMVVGPSVTKIYDRHVRAEAVTYGCWFLNRNDQKQSCFRRRLSVTGRLS